MIEVTTLSELMKNNSFGFKDCFTCNELYPNELFAVGYKKIFRITNSNIITTCFTLDNITAKDFKYLIKHPEILHITHPNKKSKRLFEDSVTTLREKADSKYANINESLEKEYSKYSINYKKGVEDIVKAPIPNEIQEKKEVKKKLPKNVDRAYNLDILNTDSNYPLEKIINGVKNFANQWKNNENKIKTCALLFHGFPGTGKTEFGKYLAAEAGLNFTVKRASEIIDKYVGETEKILASVFNTAKANKSIIMIDEADTFLESRAKADRSFEISRVNELLCQMEQHEGIIICSTNFLTNLDSAAMRRFIFKIEFKPLTNEGKQQLAKSMFNEVCFLPEDLSKINDIELLTPGDFKAVRDRMLIIHSEKSQWEEILDELKLEVQYKINDPYYKKYLKSK